MLADRHLGDQFFHIARDAHLATFAWDLDRRTRLMRAHLRAEIADKFAAMLCERFGVSFGFAYRRGASQVPFTIGLAGDSWERQE